MSSALSFRTFQDKVHAVPTHYRLGLIMLFLFLVSSCIYAGSLKNDFVWDDIGVFVEDPLIRDFENIPGFFMSPLTLGGNQDQQGINTKAIRYYRPLTSTLHVVEHHLFGTDPFGYKLLNLLVNSVVVVLAFLLVRKLSGNTVTAFLAALLYSAIPARGEVVYWAYSDSHILASLFILMALLTYLHQRTITSLVLMGIALLFQEIAILTPAILASYELLVAHDDRNALQKAQRITPFVILSIIYFVARQAVVGQLATSPLPLANQVKAIYYISAKYLKILFLPDAPVTMYLYRPDMFGPEGPVGMVTNLMVLLILATGIIIWFSTRSQLFWFIWFFIWIAVNFNIGAYGDYLMSEKLLYLAALGPCVLLASLSLKIKRFRHVMVTLLIFVFAWHANLSQARASYWTNTTVYLDHLLAFEPDYEVAHYQSGVVSLEAGDYDKAISHFDKVVSLRPEMGSSMQPLLANTYSEKGRSLAEAGQLGKAIKALEKARLIEPDRSATYNSLGIVYYLMGKMALATQNWKMALTVDPTNSEALRNLQTYGFPAAQPGIKQ